ncbi:MAG TPA: hypothetical protein DCL60_06160 [Armatimonadetes bacterium]|nr:hypothetical protein [Armatimonadota bacterium]
MSGKSLVQTIIILAAATLCLTDTAFAENGAPQGMQTVTNGTAAGVSAEKPGRKLAYDEVAKIVAARISQHRGDAELLFSLNQSEFAEERRAFILPLLETLNFCSDNNVPREGVFPQPKEPEARKQNKALYDLQGMRFIIQKYIGAAYLRPPYNVEELRQIATETLCDRTMVTDIMIQVEPYITKSINIPAPKSWDGVAAEFNMYRYLGDASAARTSSLSPETYGGERRKFIVPLIKAAKVLLDNKVPNEHPEEWTTIMCAPDPSWRKSDPELWEKRRKEYDDMGESLRQIRVLDDLVCSRFMLLRGIGGYYTSKPSDTEELRRIATDILHDETTVEVIMAGAGVKPSEEALNSSLMREHRKFFSGGAPAP